MVADRELMERDLAEHLVDGDGAGLLPRSDQAQLKTYIVEAHRARELAQAREALEDAAARAGAELSSTQDPSLFLLTASVATESDAVPEPAGFWLDSAKPRFWLLHSKTTAKPAQQALRLLIGSSQTSTEAGFPVTSSARCKAHSSRSASAWASTSVPSTEVKMWSSSPNRRTG